MITTSYVASLAITVGVAGSGKSTWASSWEWPNSNRRVVVSTDAIREELCGTRADQTRNREVWLIAHYRIESLLASGSAVLLDATNLLPRYRTPLLAISKRHCRVMPSAHRFATPTLSCIQRNHRRGEHAVPEEVLRSQLAAWDLHCTPEKLKAEGFHVVTHRPSDSELTQLSF